MSDTRIKRRADVDCAYCGWCDHHADRHTYGAGAPFNVPCADCPDGTCRRVITEGAAE